MTFVLIHGAWHGAWCWTSVVSRLERDGHTAIAATIKGHGPGADRTGVTHEDFIESLVREIVDRDLRDVILVGHSWAGYLLTTASPRLADRLRGLIFLSALVPADGESMFDANPPEISDEYRTLAGTTADHSVPLSWERFRTALMQTAGEEAARVAYRLLTPVPYATFADSPRTTKFQDLDVPRAFILAESDVALPAERWELFRSRLGRHEFLSMPGDHEALLTDPDAVAVAIETVSANMPARSKAADAIRSPT